MLHDFTFVQFSIAIYGLYDLTLCGREQLRWAQQLEAAASASHLRRNGGHRRSSEVLVGLRRSSEVLGGPRRSSEDIGGLGS